MRKKIFGLLIMLSAVQSIIMAQSTSSGEKPYLVTEGKQWAVCRITYKGEYWTDTYRLQGDTVIDGKTYKIEYESREADLSDLKPSGRYMREENGKVYSTTDKDKREELFFDYTMQVGDTLCYNPTIDYYGNVWDAYQCIRLVAIRDTVIPNSDGKVRKCYYVQSGWYEEGKYRFNEAIDGEYLFVEDIGFFPDGLSYPSIDLVGVGRMLLYVKQDDTMLYQQEEGVVWRNSSSGEDKAPYLITEGKKWHIKTQVPYVDDRYTNDVFMWVEGDTIVDGISCKKLYKQTRNIWDSSMGTIEVGYCRQADKRYYQNGELMFDFSLQEGDVFYPKVGKPLTVKRTGNMILDDGVSRKYLMVVSGGEDADTLYNSDYWVEGVGSLKMGILTNDFQSYGVVKELQSCSYNGKYIYNKEEESDPSRPTTKRGYGIYHGDSYLYAYTINEAEAVTDSTDFARWNDKTVIYFDVDTVGSNAFSGATFRQGQVLYFTERLNCIMSDAFSNIMILDGEQAEENPFGDLCIVFSGNAPSIEKNSISNYADTTYRITYVVPDLIEYIGRDIQWTYAQLVTIDDFVGGYISVENEVSVSDSTEVDVTVEDNDNQNAPLGGPVLRASVRPRGDIPVRIGEGENKDIYSRAPAWQRYTVEVVVTDCHADTLYTASQECRAHGQCDFVIELPYYPDGGYVYLHARSIDLYGHATEWNRKRVNLLGDEYEGDYVTDANVDLNNTADAAELTATVGTDSIRITGYYMSNCGGGLYCVANARGSYIELLFHDGASANCIEYHYVDFMIPRFSEEITGIDVIEPYPLKVKVIYSSITDVDASEPDAPYYDLMGRKVANPTRGIYIRNGNKVVMP